MRRLLGALLVAVAVAPAAAQAAPTARFSSRTTVQAGHVVKLRASSSACDARPCTYRWRDLGRDNSAAPPNRRLGGGRTLSLRFSNPGVKNIELRVTNRLRQRSSKKRRITVAPRRPSSGRPPAPLPAPAAAPHVHAPATPAPAPAAEPPRVHAPATPAAVPAAPPAQAAPATPVTAPPLEVPAVACTTSATPSSFAKVFAGASGGTVICLASGDYGQFEGAQKTGRVTIAAQPGATPTMSVFFYRASNVTFDGITFTEFGLQGATRDITVRNSRFTGFAVIRTETWNDANVLFERNQHLNVDSCSSCFGARMVFPGRNESAPSGVIIRDSLFAGGNTDGIATGANGVQIIGNVLRDLIQPADPNINHTDAVQLYGSKNTLVRGNFFSNVSVGIMAADGADHEVIEDNVFQGPTYAIQLGADRGSIIRHNTMVDGVCAWGLRCGIVSLGGKGSFKGSGTVIRDNILGGISVQESTPEMSHNLVRDQAAGANAIRGLPTYVGGALPSTYEGHALAPTSLGKGDASDGTDRGARIP